MPMHTPGHSRLTKAYNNLSPFEYGVFVVLAVLLIVGAVSLVGGVQTELSTTTPTRGGSYTEGIVGFPRYVNPVLARSNADQDLSALIYAGLTKLTKDGEVELDLAETVDVSASGETYTFTISDEAYFHDGHPVLAEDVVYTINMINEQRVNSPHQVDWSGVDVQATGEKTVVFNLTEPFQDFLYVTRVGILPKHLWHQESTQTFPFSNLNTAPVGAGPYEVESVDRNNEGIPTYYELTASDNYPDTPYIDTINLRFFSDSQAREQAFRNNRIDTMYGIDPAVAKELEASGERVLVRPLNRVFAVFFNQNQNESLADIDVRRALAQVIPKQEIVRTVLSGYGSVINGPLPAKDISSTPTSKTVSSSTLEEARAQLEAAGWELDKDGRRLQDGRTLSVSLTTSNIPALQQTAEIIARQWEKIGVRVKITTLPTSDLSRDIIRTREYEALLFGQSINPSRNLHPFWHSEGQEDPGLNLAMYANPETDEALEALRTTSSSSQRQQLEQQIIDTIVADQPAVFLYTPAFIYVVPESLQNILMPAITTPDNRFAEVEDWYIKTNQLWNVFTSSPDPETSVSKQSTTTNTNTTTRSEVEQ